MKISVFGNKDYEPDSTPIKIIPELAKMFLEFVFVTEDPNELNIPKDKDWWIIDTVKDLKSVQVIEMGDLKRSPTGQVSMHGFDLGTHLFWITKLNKDLKIHIIGVPMNIPKEKALSDIAAILKNITKPN